MTKLVNHVVNLHWLIFTALEIEINVVDGINQLNRVAV